MRNQAKLRRTLIIQVCSFIFY